ncbi:MAG TPA: PQQ-binding-like beta-propeller repeat protein [bacterium]|nr:PQQ-binding-like beta-propeller repeat protein [bacterium]
MKKLFIFIAVIFIAASASLFPGTPGTLKWSIKPESSNIPSPAIAKDGTVYITGGIRLKAINPDTGGILWSYEPGTGLGSAPVILPDKSICVAGANGTLYIVSPSGSHKYSRSFGGGSITWQIAVNSDGTIFFAYGNTLYCLSPELQTIWTYVASDTLNSSPVLGQDGSIYLSCQTARTFYGINIDGTLKWRQTYPWAAGNSYDDWALLGIPSVGAAGQIYVGDQAGYFREVDPVTGALVREWAAAIDRSSMTCQSAICSNGYNIEGCANAYLCGFNPTTGNYRLHVGLSGSTYSTPAIGSDGTIYLGVSWQTTHFTYYFYALTPRYANNYDFVVRWSYLVGHEMSASPALGSDGTAYIGTKDGYVYAIYTENTGYQNNSPFPKYRHDNSNTGNSIHNSFLVCQPSIYDFGNVNLGTSSSKHFRLPMFLQLLTTSGRLSSRRAPSRKRNF